MGNTSVMAATRFDIQLKQYWPQLTDEQKGFLVTIMESFLHCSAEADIAQYNEDLEQALQRVQAGEFTSHEQVKEMLKNSKK